MRKIQKYNEFKLLLEDDDFQFDVDNDNDINIDNDSNQDDIDIDNDIDNDIDDNNDKIKVFNEEPSYYIRQSLKSIERKILSLFEPPIKNDNGRTEKDESSYHSQGVELIESKITDMDMQKTLIIKYHDQEYTYHLMITIKIDQGIPEKSDIEMDYSMIKECGVKFKKYDISDNLLGELDRKKVNISDIDQDYIDSLNADLNDKYNVDNNFEIEYKKDE